MRRVHAFGDGTGVRWEGTAAASFAATTIGDGVVLTSYTDPATGAGAPHGYHAATGAQVLDLPLPARTLAPPTPVGCMLLQPMGNFVDGSGSAISAYVVPDCR